MKKRKQTIKISTVVSAVSSFLGNTVKQHHIHVHFLKCRLPSLIGSTTVIVPGILYE